MEWNEPLEPNGMVRYYVIAVYESDSSLASKQENSTSADRSRTIGRLEPFTNYSVIVQAVIVEPGSESEVAVVRTNESGRLGEKMKIRSSLCMCYLLLYAKMRGRNYVFQTHACSREFATKCRLQFHLEFLILPSSGQLKLTCDTRIIHFYYMLEQL